VVTRRGQRCFELSVDLRVVEMSSEVKIYRVEGVMLISHEKYPTWQKFTKEVRAVNEKQALEKVYSILGSNHKLKRYHIRVKRIYEISPEEATRREIIHLTRTTRLVEK